MGRARDDDEGGGPFSELVTLLRRHESEERRAADVEADMQRLLLMARDAPLREQLVQAQGVRRVTLISKSASTTAIQRFCAGILGCLARSEHGRLSASSCANWQCASHRHNCPLFMLLNDAHCCEDRVLRRVSAAALLAFSVQNECQLQIDSLSGITVLLRTIDAANEPGGDGELAVYAAATLWNMCKAPALLLRIETLHAILKDKLLRKLSQLLLVPLEPFQLALTSTGERGTSALVDFEGDNLNVLLTSSIGAQLSIVLAVENYTGRSRTLADQYRARSAGSNRIKEATDRGKHANVGSSIAHYDESGVLASRTCAVCNKSISTSLSLSHRFLLCAREGCGQTFHVRCSRWASLDEQDRHAEHFYCDSCRVTLPLYYWDFVAENPREYGKLLSQTMFEAVRISRVDSPADDGVTGASSRQGDRTASSVMLFDSTFALVGVGTKRYRIAASSRDPETVIVMLTHLMVDAFPAMQQQQRRRNDKLSENSRSIPAWPVSYARQDAATTTTAAPSFRKDKASAPPAPAMMQLVPGAAMFWPSSHARDVRAWQYIECSLQQLERTAIYEFRGGGDVSGGGDRPSTATVMFAIGAPIQASTAEPGTSVQQDNGIWSSLFARKAACMKLLTEQIGRLRVARSSPTASRASEHVEGHQPTTLPVPVEEGEVVVRSTTKLKMNSKARTTATTSSPSTIKPHFPGKKLHRIVVTTTTTATI